MRIARLGALSVLALVLSQDVVAFAAIASPQAVVQSFLEQHFKTRDRMYLAPENVRREHRWLSPVLYRLLLNEFRREKEAMRPDTGLDQTKPFFVGDVFTCSESPPQVYRLGHTQMWRMKAEVVVWCYWNDDSVGRTKSRVVILLTRVRGHWLIDNIQCEDDDDLVRLLKRPNYFGE